MAAPAFRSASLGIALAILSTGVSSARAQTHAPTRAPGAPGALDAFSDAVEKMAEHVSPSVVQILVTRYGGQERTGRANVMAGWEQSIGSG